MVEIISQRVPRNVRRNCANLRVAENIGLVCDARLLAFVRPWENPPCRKCKKYKKGKAAFGEIVDVPYETYKPPVVETTTYTLKEIEDSEKGTSYEFEPTIDERLEEIVEELAYTTIDESIMREKNGFRIFGMFAVSCCDALFGTPYPIYADEREQLYRVSDDSAVRCINGHHLTLSSISLAEIKKGEWEYENAYFSFVENIKKNPDMHTRTPKNCVCAKHLERHIYRCEPNELRLGEDALCCQTCMFWELKI